MTRAGVWAMPSVTVNRRTYTCIAQLLNVEACSWEVAVGRPDAVEAVPPQTQPKIAWGSLSTRPPLGFTPPSLTATSTTSANVGSSEFGES